ncbi:Rv3235 family protein [Nocardia sp. X0981]
MADFRPVLYRVPVFEPFVGPVGGQTPVPDSPVRPAAEIPGAGGCRGDAGAGGVGEGTRSGEPAPPRRPPGSAAASANAVPRAATRTATATAPGCGNRPDRRSLRRNRSAPAGVGRLQRAGHTAARPTAPDGAREFAGKALRVLLEVLDRRRPVAQLGALCTPALVCAVGSLVAHDHVPGRVLGAAVPAGIRLFPAGEHAAELVAMYQRGPRRLAVAGRLEHGATGWKLTALRIM